MTTVKFTFSWLFYAVINLFTFYILLKLALIGTDAYDGLDETFQIYILTIFLIGISYVAVEYMTQWLIYKYLTKPIYPVIRLLMLMLFLYIIFTIPLAFAEHYEFIAESRDCISKTDHIDFTYFSFTTFTTLGYGDHAPIGHCREIAVAEAMIGITTMPILIALGMKTFDRNSYNIEEN